MHIYVGKPAPPGGILLGTLCSFIFLKATSYGFTQLSFQMQLHMYEDMLLTKDASLQKVGPLLKAGGLPGLAGSVQT